MAQSNKLVEEFIKRSKLSKDTLYHYCPQASMLNIISSRELWLGRTIYTNDKMEIKYFVEEVGRCLRESISPNKLQVCNSIMKDIETELNLDSRYLFCMTELRDDAAQWERYADNACGVSIGFNVKTMITVLFYAQLIFTRVWYGYDPYDHGICKVLTQYIEHDRLTEGFTDIKGVISNLLIGAVRYKHRSFQSEKEWRLGNYFGDQFKEKPGRSKAYLQSIHQDYKMINGVIKDVLVVNLEALCSKKQVEFDDLFNEIIIGPRSRLTVDELQGYLREQGYQKIAEKVTKSTCPLR